MGVKTLNLAGWSQGDERVAAAATDTDADADADTDTESRNYGCVGLFNSPCQTAFWDLPVPSNYEVMRRCVRKN
ncbi:hypothetical protein G7Z17_g8343 [Cylindrodendrum hubeiense]|uniref:Uncharacterized protein n=1 Tax=Cylindrodendrum hubeiense TaxID=595255 RepID=A0A9P5H260_9HYPO|nr:hypothetical protein G7Z17_g8343 [Cylindrodendrum hubeiense]